MAGLIEMVQEGESALTMLENPSLGSLVMRHYKAVEYFQGMYSGKRKRESVEVRYYSGETGSGKSHRAQQEAEAWCAEHDSEASVDVYRHNGTKWWDGYTNQRVLIMDDFEISREFPLVMLLKVTDKYKYNAERKGSTVWLQAELILITSSKAICTFDEGGQFLRRCKVVVEGMKMADRDDVKEAAMQPLVELID